MASEEVTPPMSRPRLTPVPRWSRDFDAMHTVSLGAEIPGIRQRRRRMARSSWIRSGLLALKSVPKPLRNLEDRIRNTCPLRS